MFWRKRKTQDLTKPASQTANEPQVRYLYWLDGESFRRARKELQAKGHRFEAALLTPCQVLKAREDRIVYAPPVLWSSMCRRQGSWYRSSSKAGLTMMMSASRLGTELDPFLEAELSASDFQPRELPGQGELQGLVESEIYRTQRPDDWERVNPIDGIFFKILFTLTRSWRRGDSLQKHWLGHRANHANFLSREFTTRVDEEDVPYSVTENAGVCSSCAEFFNIVAPESRKLVRACPGSVSFAGARRSVYYDVKPRRTPIDPD